MGLIDRMRAQASQLAEKAQEAGKTTQAKVEAVQARHAADRLVEELGRLAYARAVGREGPGDSRRSEELVEKLRHFEAEYGPLDSPGDEGDPAAP